MFCAYSLRSVLIRATSCTYCPRCASVSAAPLRFASEIWFSSSVFCAVVLAVPLCSAAASAAYRSGREFSSVCRFKSAVEHATAASRWALAGPTSPMKSSAATAS